MWSERCLGWEPIGAIQAELRIAAALASNAVSANVHGSFHGNETIKVVGGTFTAAFGSGATNGATDDFWFKYTTSNHAACAKKWINASTGNSGDIATFCA